MGVFPQLKFFLPRCLKLVSSWHRTSLHSPTLPHSLTPPCFSSQEEPGLLWNHKPKVVSIRHLGPSDVKATNTEDLPALPWIIHEVSHELDHRCSGKAMENHMKIPCGYCWHRSSESGLLALKGTRVPQADLESGWWTKVLVFPWCFDTYTESVRFWQNPEWYCFQIQASLPFLASKPTAAGSASFTDGRKPCPLWLCFVLFSFRATWLPPLSSVLLLPSFPPPSCLLSFFPFLLPLLPHFQDGYRHTVRLSCRRRRRRGEREWGVSKLLPPSPIGVGQGLLAPRQLNPLHSANLRIICV